jgi:hypothetical protein
LIEGTEYPKRFFPVVAQVAVYTILTYFYFMFVTEESIYSMIGIVSSLTLQLCLTNVLEKHFEAGKYLHWFSPVPLKIGDHWYFRYVYVDAGHAMSRGDLLVAKISNEPVNSIERLEAAHREFKELGKKWQV